MGIANLQSVTFNNLFFRATAEDCLDSSYFKEQPYRKYAHTHCTMYMYGKMSMFQDRYFNYILGRKEENF